MADIFEYRGVSDLVYAEVTKDDSTGYTTGPVKSLAGVAEISKATNSSSETHYYDNLPAIVVQSMTSDEITINASAIPLEVLAELKGQTYDSETGTYIEAEGVQKTWAIGYKTQNTKGEEYYVWRLKGSITVGDETHQTKNDGTDTNGQELTFTGISTIHKFQKTGKQAMAVTVNTALDLIANKAGFFDSVQTPDTIQAKTVTPSVSVIPSRAEVEVGQKVQLSAVVVPASAAVTWSSGNTSYATVDAATGEVTGAGAGTVDITASITVGTDTFTDKCSVTVSAPVV